MIRKVIFGTVIGMMLATPVFAQDGAIWEWVVEPQYYRAEPFKDGLASVSKGKIAEYANGGPKMGLINTKGDLVVPMEYSWIGEQDGQRVVSKTIVREEGDEDGVNIGWDADGTPIITKSWSFDKKGKLKIVKPKEDRFAWTWEVFAGKDATWFRNDDQESYIGVKNKTTGEVIIPAMYDQLTPFSEGYAIARNYDEGMGIIDDKNNIIIPLEYAIWNSFINDQLLGPNEPDYMLEITGNNLTRGISKDGKWGLIDKKGEWVVPLTYDSQKTNLSDFGDIEVGVADFSGGIATVQKDGKWGVIDTQGNSITPIQYEKAFVWNGFAGVRQNGKWGSVDKAGNVVVPFEYDGIGAFSEGRITVEKSGSWGAVDINGNIVVPLIYDRLDSFNDGYAVVEDNGKKGFVNKNGNVIVPIIYDDAWGFTDGLACVKLGDKWGYAKPVEKVEEDIQVLTKVAMADQKYINMQIGNPNANDSAFLTQIDKEDKNVVPIIRDNRTLLPIRFISESLNGKIEWFEDEQKIIIEKNDKIIELVIGSNIAKINGQQVTLEVAPIIENSRTLLPIRFIAETLDCEVKWDEENQVVTIIE
ncbi:MAG TPA: hypothetical protein DCP90_02325 [Clostridiales bacterium]|nr:MAG: hypothetical protein A2Y22_05180 [Clostridiales bacterium GWD2_32_59]HAN09431.1 hypothetical protein [Clostridiales bacterium]